MPGIRGILATGLLVAAVGCTTGPDLDELPIGSALQLTQGDGGLVEGRLLDRTPESVTIDEGLATRQVPRTDVAEVRLVAADGPMPAPPPEATYRRVIVPSGTTVQLNLATPVDTGADAEGDAISAVLAAPVKIDEMIVLPEGSPVAGRIAALESAGKVNGRASVTLAFTAVQAGEEAYELDARFQMVAPATRVDDAKMIGIPAAGGAILGAVLGGKQGAAIGAATGGGAGTAAVLMTPGDEVRLAAGTTLSVTLDTPLDVVVPIVRQPGREKE